MNKTRFTYLSFILWLLVMATFLVWSTQATEADTTKATQDSSLSSSGADSLIYLPIIADITPFAPPADTTLPGGIYTFSSFDIPPGTTVTVMGDVHITVMGNTNIAGTLAGNCVKMQILGQQNVAVTGLVDNKCSDPEADDKDLVIHSNRGDMTVGTPDEPATMRTSGNLDIGNAPDLEEWEFDVLPHEQAEAPMAPVCSARAHALIDTALPDWPAEVAFFGEGADPNGGPVSYQWDFGDGASATERDPLHDYTAAGVYEVTLTVTDEDGLTCQAGLQLAITDETGVPDSPATWIDMPQPVIAADSPYTFTAPALYLPGIPLTYTWRLGDGTETNEAEPTHTYSEPGRYEVSLTVIAGDGSEAEATTAVYAYDPNQQPDNFLARNTAASPCLTGGPNVFNLKYDGGKARDNHRGRDLRIRGAGNIYLGPQTNLKAADGGDGTSRIGSGTVRGRNGRVGGRLLVLIGGQLTICGGAVLAGGNGGQGGYAISNTPADGHAIARGGRGGNASRLLALIGTQQVNFESPFGLPVYIRPGDAGDGGRAEANGGDGDPDCTTAQNGAAATASGGDGGNASKTFLGSAGGLGFVRIQTGWGGDGGDAKANAGAGGEAVCPTIAQGGQGRDAKATGGRGGDARFTNVPAPISVDADAFTAGNGGMAEAFGGNGGRAVATPPGGTNATAGNGGDAAAAAGHGGRGRNNGDGGDSTAEGGWGGQANATGEDGDPCEDGLDATATGGHGGDARAHKGKARGAGASDGTANAVGGHAGHGIATGGTGGDCPDCGGDGGAGGEATATGGNGGTASGDGNNSGGDGGDGDALGGNGGDGGDCDCNKLNPQAGGNGGDGGDATSVAGQLGGPDGQPGTNALKGGDGGDGGDGDPPGDGGDGGIGTGTPDDIPDGDPGQPGNPCPPLRIWWIYHSTIPNGPILPGTEMDLGTYDEPNEAMAAADSVITRFMDAEDLAEWEEIDPTNIFYDKLDGDLFIGQGGIRYEVGEFADTFPVIGLDFTVLAEMPESVLLVGYYQGERIGSVTNQGSEAPGEPETFVLPDPDEFESDAPYYDRLEIIILAPISFYHWWVIIIDP